VHLSNFKNKGERTVLLVLPQFIAGIAFTLIFIQFGLWAAILGHFFYDVIVMAGLKAKDTLIVNLINGTYYLVIGAVLWLIAQTSGFSLAALLPWLNGLAVPLVGVGFFGYVVLLLLVSCIAGLIVNVLFLDTEDLDEKTYSFIVHQKGIGFVLLMMGIAAGTVGLVLLGNWILSLFISSLITRILVLAVLHSIIMPAKSGSAIARATIVNLPVMYLVIMSFTVLGFWAAFGIALFGALLDIFPQYIESE
jgi:hypothetical protein